MRRPVRNRVALAALAMSALALALAGAAFANSVNAPQLWGRADVVDLNGYAPRELAAPSWINDAPPPGEESYLVPLN